MPIMYKLLTQGMTSYAGMKWELGETNHAGVPGTQMCTDQVLHCYADPYLAVLLNPLHADIKNPRLFKIAVPEVVATDGLKHASKSQALLEELPLPVITTQERVRFAITCALQVHPEGPFAEWAQRWLTGMDRSAAAARAAGVYAARVAGACAADCAAAAADYAANYADYAEYAAAEAARAAVAATGAGAGDMLLLRVVHSVFGGHHE